MKEMKKGRRGWKKFLLVACALLAVALAWVGYDLYGPRRTSLREFDANEVARLETAMWRSYYERRRVALYNQMTELLRTQYRLPLVRSNTVAYQAAQAAFVFKDGRTRTDYEKALPHLVNFYTDIRKVSDVPFDARRAAALELEWWIIHRQRKNHTPAELTRALAELPAELYQVPAERLLEHARLRAEAMTIRDNRAAAGGVTEDDWRRIDELLHASWQSLRRAVNS
ncbi:MAG TPA: hypothetical protein VNA19_00310 [Pyrinomonadaceae bacterium]|jgi:hypothetical protein|nr:hypothetical protein [Pyrinomonadaceae bacterium]